MIGKAGREGLTDRPFRSAVRRGYRVKTAVGLVVDTDASAEMGEDGCAGKVGKFVSCVDVLCDFRARGHVSPRFLNPFGASPIDLIAANRLREALAIG